MQHTKPTLIKRIQFDLPYRGQVITIIADIRRANSGKLYTTGQANVNGHAHCYAGRDTLHEAITIAIWEGKARTDLLFENAAKDNNAAFWARYCLRGCAEFVEGSNESILDKR